MVSERKGSGIGRLLGVGGEQGFEQRLRGEAAVQLLVAQDVMGLAAEFGSIVDGVPGEQGDDEDALGVGDRLHRQQSHAGGAGGGGVLQFLSQDG
jgi:hypothetical protein